MDLIFCILGACLLACLSCEFLCIRETSGELTPSQYKTVAFHFAQLIGLMNGKEFFTKADLMAAFPDIAPFLRRQAVCPFPSPSLHAI